ncbi:GntR family transcriptional regulator [Pseudooctadecabacter jejudonensis]|uniref:Putative HTH-type transcriptional regulator YdfH n=1 Tax=Pseudooctadecabacter jejudonensis TaxID=1391910 RepID=A0A1Y5TG03_9RHOB|nr:GntR family transcriptional regulator [Pseudooctadecabacter jejudonensis]SLN63219.1 putative HTH-type transcriptional regulator YdfH [Pseudooctadecabacter jejudonensis]
MPDRSTERDTRSTADVVFDQLYEEIASLHLLPGTKISEAEVARRFGVSRQPIRDAFRRLGDLNLLNIRPQRATVVRRFSMQEIENARFLRLAVELEVIEAACAIWDQTCTDMLRENIDAQKAALAQHDTATFHDLDYEFHLLICQASGKPLAFDTIQSCKRSVDRLCVLSMSHDEERDRVLADHLELLDALSAHDVPRARALLRHHVSRIDKVISEIHHAHSDYFQ